ncbi:MAG: 2-oxoacid:acceptor oxidoreductase family protein [bacterium]|jgi:pyruvate ferredoxin oxidoreductase gamma subunit
MAKLVEVRWHGRGGQGAKTAALLLAEAASDAGGKYIQAFPEYGPERMGAPVQAFTRISDAPITMHCNVTNPGTVVILDSSLIGGSVDVTSGVGESGVYIVNTNATPEEMRAKLGIKAGKVYTVDANQIALDTIGRAIPNTPMMGALIKVTGILPLETLLADTEKKLNKKFAGRAQIVEGNLQAIKRAYQEVKGE